jgi:hypothetical protein
MDSAMSAPLALARNAGFTAQPSGETDWTDDQRRAQISGVEEGPAR